MAGSSSVALTLVVVADQRLIALMESDGQPCSVQMGDSIGCTVRASTAVSAAASASASASASARGSASTESEANVHMCVDFYVRRVVDSFGSSSYEQPHLLCSVPLTPGISDDSQTRTHSKTKADANSSVDNSAILNDVSSSDCCSRERTSKCSWASNPLTPLLLMQRSNLVPFRQLSARFIMRPTYVSQSGFDWDCISPYLSRNWKTSGSSMPRKIRILPRFEAGR